MQIETESYNERRYGKPWIAIVTFESASKPNFSFGDWVGEIGYQGVLEIEANEGDIVARGQKDHRKPRNSAADYYIMESGELIRVSKKEAYLHYKHLGSEQDLLIERREKLLKEIDEINERLNEIELKAVSN